MNKFKQVMKDEEGLTLVELLAVVVIMAIIAGIAVVSISRVIQRTREDAQVSNVQQMLASANLYDIDTTEGLNVEDTPLSKFEEEGSIKAITFTDKKAEIKFNKDERGIISVSLPAEVLQAGGLTRDQLFRDGVGSETTELSN